MIPPGGMLNTKSTYMIPRGVYHSRSKDTPIPPGGIQITHTVTMIDTPPACIQLERLSIAYPTEMVQTLAAVVEVVAASRTIRYYIACC